MGEPLLRLLRGELSVFFEFGGDNVRVGIQGKLSIALLLSALLASAVAAQNRIVLRETNLSKFSVLRGGSVCSLVGGKKKLGSVSARPLQIGVRFSVLDVGKKRTKLRKTIQKLESKRATAPNRARLLELRRTLSRLASDERSCAKGFVKACIDRTEDGACIEKIPSLCEDGIDHYGSGLVGFPLDPACASIDDSRTRAIPDTKPAYAVTWSTGPVDATNLVPFVWGSATGYSADQIADQLKARPKGQRYLMVWDAVGGTGGLPIYARDTNDYCGDQQQYQCLWWDHGLAQNGARMQNYFQMLKDRGADVEYWVLDTELGSYMGPWGLHQCGGSFYDISCVDVDNRLDAIETDSRYISEIKPQLQTIGFPVGQPLRTVLKSDGNTDAYLQWDGLMVKRQSQYLNQYLFGALTAVFPDAKMSDFNFVANSTAQAMISNVGLKTYRFFSGDKSVGTNQAPRLYGPSANIVSHYLDDTTQLKGNPFHGFMFDVNTFRAAMLSSSRPVSPWFAFKEYTTQYNQSDYFQEAILHVMLGGAGEILYWNPDHDHTPAATDESDRLLDATLKEFQTIAGFDSNETAVERLATWSDDYVLSRMNSAGRAVYRFTPELSTSEQAASTIVIEADLTVTVQTPKKRLVFSNAKIWRPENATSSKGLWIVSGDAVGPEISLRE
ncbi:MAG: hypothetical protein J0M12_13110 [Deltaproteobacteria bacterium]|nr:hypothetical protein [Deltaproteobacteria bacterium]